MARWATVAAAGAVVVVVGGTGVLLTTRPADRPAEPVAAAAASPPRTLAQLRVRDGDVVTGSGTVLAAPGKPVRFCAPVAERAIGYPGPERPPDCSLGVDLVGADLDRLTEPEAFGTTRWGQAAVTGRYRAGTITVTAQAAPVRAPDPGSSLPERPPCPAPPGGWRPGGADRAATEALAAVVTGNPTAYGEVAVTYPDGHPSGPTAAPGYRDATEVLLVTTRLDPASAEKQLRAHFAGNLCVRPAPRSRADTDAVWRRIEPDSGGGAWQRHGVYQGGPDYLSGRVAVSLTIVDAPAYRWLAGADAGTGTVDAHPWLRPA